MTGFAKSDGRRAAEGNERVRVTTLDNGARIVTEAMPQLMTTALGVWIGAGARHEDVAEHGISHLLEHMAFKGTADRTAREIVEAIEDVGGDLNAATSLEQTAYYARVLADDVPVAIDVLSDIVRNPLFDADELAREKDVILQEIAATNDSPDDTVYDLAQAASFRDHAIGRPIIGKPETVTAISQAQLRSFMKRAYEPGAIVISAAGAVDHDELADRVAKALGDLERPEPREAGPAEAAPAFVGDAAASDAPFEQAHILLSLDGPAYQAPDFFASQVFSILFGGGMSSRLFQEVREQRGLCYSIYSTSWAMTDCGLFMMHAATGADTVTETGAVMIDELAKLAAEGPDEREVARAKAQMKAGLLMGLESPAARADQLARQTLALNRTLSPTDLIARIDAIDAVAVQAVAERYAQAKSATVSVVGAGPKSLDVADAARARFLAAA